MQQLRRTAWLSLLVAWLAALPLEMLPATADAEDGVLKRFGSGSGADAVGIIEASEDSPMDGPQALFASEDGDIFVLDQINNRILRFDPKNSSPEVRALNYPADLTPTDLIVRKSDILVWDGSVHTLQPAAPDNSSSRGLEEVNTRAADDPYTLSTFAQMGSEDPGSDSDLLDANSRGASSREPRPRARQYVASRGHGSVIADVIPEKGEAGAQIEVRAQGETEALARLRLRVRDRLGAVEFLDIDNHGRMFVLAENIPASASDAAAFVVRYASSGAMEGIYELPLAQSIALSRRFVTVSGDGDVYFLKTVRGGVEVLAVGFRALGNKQVIDVRPERPSFEYTSRDKGLIAAVRPLTRQRVIETAFAFEGVQWKLTASAYGHDPDTACSGLRRIRRPGYLHGKLGQMVRGVPYCWGCHGSLAQFQARIERGTMAGNVCTHNEPRSDVAGVDCSAFVSAAWGLANHFTTAAIPAITTRLSNAWDLQPGDALNKPGSHVMLFLRFTADRKAEVMESSTGGCNGRVCRNIYPLSAILARGYAPVRFRALTNDTSVVAQDSEPEKAARTSKHHHYR
jgi:hypothetical protein